MTYTPEQVDLMEYREQIALETLPSIIVCLQQADDDVPMRQAMYQICAGNMQHFTELFTSDVHSTEFYLKEALEVMHDSPDTLTPSQAVLVYMAAVGHLVRIYEEKNPNVTI